MNRGAARLRIFDDTPDYQAFEKVLAQAREREGMRVCAYVLMPNHFHLVLWPRRDGQLSDFMRWLTMTHTQRWHAHRHTAGGGHLYQSRFKSFPIELDDHFLRVCRYVERNPLRANLAPSSADWPWGSLACRTSRPDVAADLLDEWPVDRPANWTRTVDRPQSQPELDARRLCASRGRPYGSDRWTQRTAARLGLESSLRPRGRHWIAAGM
jgi:putative transposase